MLPSTLRLTHDEVIRIACDWVRSRYSVVPPVVLVLEFSEQAILQLEQKCGHRLPPEERARCLNKWQVSFACSRDTDVLGMPQGLHVVVDDLTSHASLAESHG
jgi:hypothetical protein